MNVLERNKLWQANKENKLKKQQELKKEDGIEECTFAPKLVSKNMPNRNRQSTTSSTGQDLSKSKYVERMNKARQNKEVKK